MGTVAFVNGSDSNSAVSKSVMIDEGDIISVKCIAEGWNPLPDVNVMKGEIENFLNSGRNRIKLV